LKLLAETFALPNMLRLYWRLFQLSLSDYRENDLLPPLQSSRWRARAGAGFHAIHCRFTIILTVWLIPSYSGSHVVLFHVNTGM
jgi:hypothetical protein